MLSRDAGSLDAVDVLVVVPTYNEAASLEAIVSGIAANGYGVLVVDDDSPDGTGRLADRLAGTHPALAVLHRPRKEGLGRALAAGFATAGESGAAVICQMDADGSHDPAELPRLVAAVDAGADVAIGSRYVAGGDGAGLAPSRSVLSRLGNRYARVALGLGVKDATTGFRAYRAGILADLDPATAVAQGYAFQIEMAWRAHRAGYRVAEVPITFRPRVGGSSKMSVAIPLEALWLVTRWGVRRLLRLRLDGSRRVPDAQRPARHDPPADTGPPL